MERKRIAFYLFYDEQGIVDDYIIYKLSELKKIVQTIVVISNSSLTVTSRKRLEAVSDRVFCRQNIGFDVWGYKEGMELYGYDKLGTEYDELILLNYTFFAPIFPFEEMFAEMEQRECDFWGISDHKSMTPNPFTGRGTLPYHIQSHFIAIRKKLLNSAEFANYWKNMPMIHDYQDSILSHESRFTKYFNDKGFSSSVYIDVDNYPSSYPTFIDIKKTIENRSPILKRRPFFHEPLWLDANAIDLKGTMKIVADTSNYDISLIRDNILRCVKPRILSTNLEMLKIFPLDTVSDRVKRADIGNKRVAVIAHIYYSIMLPEIYGYLKNIPVEYDLYISTATKDDKDTIDQALREIGHRSFYEIRVVEENRGRDMSALFITFNDICLDSTYDYICRIHSKKSPQVQLNVAESFKHHLYDNLLGSESYTTSLLAFLTENEKVGVLIPPIVHIGHPTMGHSWFINRPGVASWAKKLKINTPLDDDTPVAAYGTMFWFRPKALEKIFKYEWKWTDFNKEPHHMDGSMAHILERLICYCAHSSGYETYHVMNTDSAENNYTKLEYKLQKIMSALSNGDVSYQYHQLVNMSLYTWHGCFSLAINILKNRVRERYPKLAKILKGPYKISRWFYRLILKK